MFRVVRNRQLVAVFAEQRDTRGKAHLVVVFTDPSLTDREFNELRADALHQWMHPTNPPEEWRDS